MTNKMGLGGDSLGYKSRDLKKAIHACNVDRHFGATTISVRRKAQWQGSGRLFGQLLPEVCARLAFLPLVLLRCLGLEPKSIYNH